jgi:hypothetical protein
MLTKKRRAQSTAEYAILLALVVAAAMGIQNEVRRAIQARVHDASVALITETGGTTRQWEPTDAEKVTTDQQSVRDRNENYVQDGNTNAPWIVTNEESSADYTSRTRQ